MSGPKSAWLDPEYVRLSSYRSWWDGSAATHRGPIPAVIDPWVTDVHPEQPPQSAAARARMPRLDDYAAWRCSCDHLVYPSQKPGDPCLVNSMGGKVGCPCADHKPAISGAA